MSGLLTCRLCPVPDDSNAAGMELALVASGETCIFAFAWRRAFFDSIYDFTITIILAKQIHQPMVRESKYFIRSHGGNSAMGMDSLGETSIASFLLDRLYQISKAILHQDVYFRRLCPIGPLRVHRSHELLQALVGLSDSFRLRAR